MSFYNSDKQTSDVHGSLLGVFLLNNKHITKISRKYDKNCYIFSQNFFNDVAAVLFICIEKYYVEIMVDYSEMIFK